ncbi:hypothetical protein F4861DRAFT_552037 [Xylaria intraflava]|nr:hypothetical protein F4861DRAFT_552037 [Xylaria intraflava]
MLRDHTLEDVPTQCARDRLMDYSLTQVDESKRGHATDALWFDLNLSDPAEYIERVPKQREEPNNINVASKKATPDRKKRFKETMKEHKLSKPFEGMNILRQ